MRPATLPLLLVLALLAVPLAERTLYLAPELKPPSPLGEGRGEGARKSREERVGGSGGEWVRRELAFPVDIAITEVPGPAPQSPPETPLELVTIVPQQYGESVP